jgi:hypothetical protein
MKVLSQLPGNKKGIFLPAFSFAALYLYTSNRFFLYLALTYAISSAAFHALISEMEGMLEVFDEEDLERGEAESKVYSNLVYKEDSSSFQPKTMLVLIAAFPMVILNPYSTWLLLQHLSHGTGYLNDLIFGLFIVQLIWTAELCFYLILSRKANRGIREIYTEAKEKRIKERN